MGRRKREITSVPHGAAQKAKEIGVTHAVRNDGIGGAAQRKRIGVAWGGAKETNWCFVG